MTKVSVVIPVYKVEKYIEKCARSLFEQTLEDMEFIFVDDYTPDNSVQILKNIIEKYPSRKNQIKIVHHPYNMGLTQARNSGLKVAAGDFIAHADSDDWVDKRMYETLYTKAKDTNSDVVYCDFFMAYQNNTKYYKTAQLIEDKKKFLKNYMISGWTSVWNMIVSRDLYQKYKILSPTTFTYCEDFHLSVRILYYAEKIEKVNSPLYYYNRINVTSLLSTASLKSEIDERVCYVDLISFFDKLGCLEDYKQELSWKILNTKQMMALDNKRLDEFNLVYPESNAYIGTCPFLNKKLKLIMWLLAKNQKFLAKFFIYVRNLIVHN